MFHVPGKAGTRRLPGADGDGSQVRGGAGQLPARGPVGTCVTGTIGLAARTGNDLLRYGSAAPFPLLLAAWLIVAARTLHGGARGRLFLPAGVPQPA